MIITNFRLYENKQKAESILKRLNIPTENEDYQKIKELTKNRANYLGQFVKWFFIDKTKFDVLEEIYNLLTSQNIKIDRPIDTFETAEELFDYIQNYENNQKANKMFQEISPKMKKLVNKEEFIKLLRSGIGYEKRIIEFFEKSKAYEPNTKDNLGVDAFYSDTKKLIDNLKGEFNSEAIQRRIEKENLNIDIIHDANTLLILKVNDYESMKILGSSDWCIVKSENHWDNYVNDFTVQYMLFDFTKDRTEREHAIGVTVSVNFGSEPNKYTAMHWANDDADGLSKEIIDQIGIKHGIK